ncbi:MAG: site-2 protease family protein [Candidatus Omnitrophica bacterium]|nr:site-2 protease family protein [Candidatus Omnitrophota bacterium]
MIVLLFILILSVLILVHEGGHFLTARKFGVKVEQFALGFGPKIYSWTSQGTEYCLCAIPLGGFVKMSGDERAQCKGAGDEYFSKSAGHRALIVLMGPVINYALAYLCFVLVFMIGFIDMDATQKKVPALIGKIVAGSPAQKAGLMSGDHILSADGHVFANWADMQDYISGAGEHQLKVTLTRGGHEVIIGLTPEMQKSKDMFGREHNVSRIGIQPPEISSADKLVVRKYGFIGAWGKAAEELWSITARTYSALWEMVSGQRSAREGMTGLIGIFIIIKLAAGIGVSVVLHVVGVISASLAIFNLLPVIPLDGGHLAYLGLEKLRGKPLSASTEEMIARIGFGLFIALAVFVFYLDFERIGLIDKIIKLFH